MTFVPPFMPPPEFYLTYFAQVVSTQHQTLRFVSVWRIQTSTGMKFSRGALHVRVQSLLTVPTETLSWIVNA